MSKVFFGKFYWNSWFPQKIIDLILFNHLSLNIAGVYMVYIFYNYSPPPQFRGFGGENKSNFFILFDTIIPKLQWFCPIQRIKLLKSFGTRYINSGRKKWFSKRGGGENNFWRKYSPLKYWQSLKNMLICISVIQGPRIPCSGVWELLYKCSTDGEEING